MPSTIIEVRRRYEPSQEVAIIDAVHAALVSAFRIPDGDKHVRLVVHEPHRFAVAPGLATVGIPPDHVTILLRESALENWGIRGGQAASDVDLGFDVTV